MTWLTLALAIGVLAAVVLVPGVIVAALLGVRGLWLVGVGVGAGVSIISIAATLAPMVGMTWGVLPVATTAAVVALVASLLRLFLWRRERIGGEARLTRWGLLAVTGAVMIVAAQVLLVVRAPEAISQTFDNIFHLNAIRFAMDTGSASPLTLGQMTSAPTGGLPFYPSAWHAMGSLVVSLSGVTIPVASNAMTVFFAALWSVSALLLVRALFGARTVVIVGAAAVAVALPAFPILPLEYGVLFPFMVSVSLLGTALALVYTAVESTGGRRWAAAVAVLGIIPGMVIAHPGGFVAFLLFATVILGWRFFRFLREGSTRGRVWACVAATVYLAAGGMAWYVLRPPAAARTWLQTETVGQAIGEVVTVSVWKGPVNVVVMGLVLVGLVVAFRRRSTAHILAILFFVVAGGLYVTVSALPDLTLRDILTGAWYNNAPRLAALLPVAWIPLGAIGTEAIWSWASAGMRSREGRTRALALLGTGAVVLLVIPQVTSMRPAVGSAHRLYDAPDDAPLLSPDERTLLSRLDDEVPEGSLIVGSAWTGTALAYALADRPVMIPHTLTDITPEMQAILDGLNKAEPRSKACHAVRELGASYVLDFDGPQVNEAHVVYTGLENLSRSPNVRLVDAQGGARLYEITGCRG